MRKEIGIAAAGAVGAVFQITLLVIRPDWVKQQWRYLVALWVLAIGLWLFATFKGEKTKKLPTVQNSGQMVAPVFSKIVGSNVHITTSAAPTAANEPLPEPLPKA